MSACASVRVSECVRVSACVSVRVSECGWCKSACVSVRVSECVRVRVSVCDSAGMGIVRVHM